MGRKRKFKETSLYVEVVDRHEHYILVRPSDGTVMYRIYFSDLRVEGNVLLRNLREVFTMEKWESYKSETFVS